MLVPAAIIWVGYRNATAMPVVRHLALALPDYPPDAPPVRLVLFSDVHVHGPDMPPSRVAAIVAEVNRLRPDIVVIAGDYIGNSWVGRGYSVDEAIAPLSGLRARYGIYGALGNNDYRLAIDDVRDALRDAGIHVLVNEARSAGPLAIAAINGRLLPTPEEWQKRRERTYASLRRTPGAKILLVHRPDEFEYMPDWVSLALAGHTHCGQVVLPVVGALQTGSDFGRKYLCGVIHAGARTLVVSAGVGTSHFPIRIGAPSDVWVIDLRAGAWAAAK